MPSDDDGQAPGLWSVLERVWSEHQNPESFANTLVGIEAGLIVALLVGLLSPLSRRLLPHLARLGGGVSFLLGLRWLALRGYRRALRERFGQIKNDYLDRAESLDLAQAFVPLTLFERATTDKDVSPLQTLEPLTVTTSDRLLILGGPGSGKSTLLRALAAGLQQERWPELHALVPVLVELRQYATEGQGTPLLQWLGLRLRQDFGLREPDRLLRSLERDGLLLILLDGLDEIGEDATAWLPKCVADLSLELRPGNRLILTCREANYDRLPDTGMLPRAGFRAGRLSDLRDVELEALINRLAPQFRARGKSPDRFLAAIGATQPIKQLHRNPLLLSISLGLYLQRADEHVPHNLAAFFEEGIKNLLSRREPSPDTEDARHKQLPLEDKLALLRCFALQRLELAADDQRDFAVWPGRDLVAQAKALADEDLSIRAEQADELARQLYCNAGLIRRADEPGDYCFAHRAMHEFCAAWELAGQGRVGLAKAFANQGRRNWTQVLIFYASMDHPMAHRLVESLVERAAVGDDPRALVLAGRCAAVLRRPESSLSKRVVDALYAALRQRPAEADRAALLRTLADVGRVADMPVRGRVAAMVRQMLGAEHPGRIAAEIGVLDHATALRLLQYLINNGGVESQRAALIGLGNLDGLGRIPLLWRLIELFARRDDAPALLHGLKLMAEILGEPAAVERLNGQRAILVDELSDDEVRRRFPFLRNDQSVSNVGRFVALAARVVQRDPRQLAFLISGDSDARHYPFNRLLKEALSVKGAAAEKQWEGLGRLRDRKTPQLLTLRRLIQLLMLGALLFGAWLAENQLSPGGLNLRDLGLVLLLGLPLGACVALAWGPWLRLIDRLGWAGQTFGIYPVWLHWPLHRSQCAPSGGASPWGGLGHLVRFPVRCLLFSPVVLLMPLALFLTAPRLAGHADDVLAVAFCRGDRQLLTSSRDGTAILWERDSGQPIHRLTGHRSAVTCVACSNDGRYLLTGTADGSATLWDAHTGRSLKRYIGSGRPLTSVALSRNGEVLALGNQSGLAQVFPVAADAAAVEHKIAGGLRGLAFSRDGLLVAAATLVGTAVIWNSETDREVRRIADPQHPVRAVALAGTGGDLRLATGADDGTARLWHVATARPIRRFDRHGEAVTGVALSQNARLLAAAYTDATPRLWSTDDSSVIHRLRGHGAAVTSIALTSSGDLVLTGSEDDTARVWDSKSGKPLWQSPIPFSDPVTWDGWDLAVLALLVVLLVLVPSTKWLEPGQRHYLRRSNRYRWVYELPDIRRWIGD